MTQGISPHYDQYTRPQNSRYVHTQIKRGPTKIDMVYTFCENIQKSALVPDGNTD